MPQTTIDLPALVTIGIVPRELYSRAEISLRSFCEHTPDGIRVIYVDSNSPGNVAKAIRKIASEKGIELIRSDYYLTSQQARNIIVPRVKTKYLVFLDNDLEFLPGWLEKMIECAEETGAAVVCPLVLEEADGNTQVHIAGGYCWGEKTDRGLVFKEVHEFYGKNPEAISLQRHATDMLEFHAFCVRTDSFERLGAFDEGYFSAEDHTDFSLAVGAAGGQIFFEPGSVIHYVLPPPFKLYDLPHFILRWSDRWNDASAARFETRWNSLVDDHVDGWLRNHRRRYLRPTVIALQRICGTRITSRLCKYLLYPMETMAHRWIVWWEWDRVKKPREAFLRNLQRYAASPLSTEQIAAFCQKKLAPVDKAPAAALSS